ncbi:glycosyltransferase family 9 protein [Paracraurococcus ruber]|uniref:ADP-heptose--LPS heptosyltransferase n=1 Tax=Paracraurococcus ruber TaxID=77675 RepID=A0ABS1D5K2_9PROT|nr:glycosyltransferase family 9 protein [Paracraurococcus ruber]MBK1662160.1 ADP-heptose--LPS heptosyltransferase [Paracraurococcus ruber]TDG33583.1 glycosyltransferase family 9 protein [Paracraurococcus ruber]
MTRPRILVIKLAALGDLVQAFGPFAAIRAHHRDAEVTLLTTPPYAELAGRSPWFDRVWADGRPAWTDLPAVWRLARRLRGAGFARVYDLQTSARSSRYRWLVGPGAEWSGIARGASHPHANPRRDLMHTVDRQREQLAMAGITEFPAPDLGWLDADIGGFGLPDRFALLVPGASPGRPGKRWPAERYAELAAALPVPAAVVGGPAERPLAAAILARAPGAVDLTGRTGYAALGAVARRAEFAVGNDTGPTHLIAAAGCPTLALFGPDSDPALCAPRGRAVAVLRQDSLAGLTVPPVQAALARIAGRREVQGA